MKKFIVMLGVILSFTMLAGCAEKSDQGGETGQQPASVEGQENADGASESAEQEENSLGYDKLVMGLDDTFAPLGFRDETGDLVGFDVELAQAVSEILGIEIEFQPIDWSMKETELNNKNIDIIWNGYSITPERAEKVLFTEAYLKNRQIVVTLADSGIETLADLAGKNVAAQAESSAVTAIDANAEVKSTFGNFYTFETNNDCLMDLEAGRSDAVVADEILIRYYISKKGPEKYAILDEDFGEEEYGIGVRKEDTALCEAINQALEELKGNGKGEEISVKWFGENILK